MAKAVAANQSRALTAFEEKFGPAASAMATRIAARNYGFDPTMIMAIIMFILNNLCKQPANEDEAREMLAEISRRHRRKCPLLFRGGFRRNGVRDIDDINDLWTDIVDDAKDNEDECCEAMLAA
jgi:hypothetical protein